MDPTVHQPGVQLFEATVSVHDAHSHRYANPPPSDIGRGINTAHDSVWIQIAWIILSMSSAVWPQVQGVVPTPHEPVSFN